MADIYIYADETGNLDYNVSGKQGSSNYFGFGTAVFDGAHAEAIWAGTTLRASLEAGDGTSTGVNLPRGFHAKNDSHTTKVQMFGEIARQAPRFDATFLKKANAYDYVQQRGDMYLYKLAWYQHLAYLAPKISNDGDVLYVVVASFGTKKRQALATAALHDVCQQTNRTFVLCAWDAATSWGLQVADYGLWAMQRHLEGRSGTWFKEYVSPTASTFRTPWGW